MAGMATGDREAARAFVRRYQQRVFGLAMTIVGDVHAAEDVAQESFVRAWKHADTFDARRASVSTWLLRITRNAAIDAVRLRRATVTDPEEMIAYGVPARGVPIDESVMATTEFERVRVALDSLPVEQRRALLLAVYFGRTAAEIAELDEIPLGTAKTRIRTALRRLREGLGADQDENEAVQ